MLDHEDGFWFVRFLVNVAHLFSIGAPWSRMCLIVFNWKPGSFPSLVVGANRDEQFDRPSDTARFWKDKPHIFAGRDALMGGTWLACSTNGRFAAVTNYHEPRPEGASRQQTYPKSRGEIPVQFVSEQTKDGKAASTISVVEFIKANLEVCHKEYGGYNAILFDGTSLVYCSNRGCTKDEDTYSFVMRELPPGLYGLSNHLLDTPWPKVDKAKIALSKALSATLTSSVLSSEKKVERVDSNGSSDHTDLAKKLIEVMGDDSRVLEVDLLPVTLGEWEETIRSSIFVDGPTFGTRTTTIVSYHCQNGFDFTEKNYKTRHPTSESSFLYQHIDIGQSHKDE